MAETLATMQQQYFNGCTWQSSTQWTGATIQTHMTSAMISLSSYMDYQVPPEGVSGLSGDAYVHESLIRSYFDQIVEYYYSQQTMEFTTENYDDMSWLALGWLEAIKFIGLHSALHYGDQYNNASSASVFYGNKYVPAFAHRARLFSDLVNHGYDDFEVLCSGGIVWGPYVAPYKNSITNELYVALNMGMYQYFPGDYDPGTSYIVNSSNACVDQTYGAVTNPQVPQALNASSPPLMPIAAHNKTYLDRAMAGYNWLTTINMTDAQGLFTDGYHLSDWNSVTNTSASNKCDERNEMVYTYNQGVLLSGIRGLWETTGDSTYLSYGYSLIDSVINATGFHASNSSAFMGLGRGGVLEDLCDANGDCSQDAQNFKGPFFHHLKLFCAPLPAEPATRNITFGDADEQSRAHASLCSDYTSWIAHNAGAAYATRNATDDYGMWWGPPAGTTNVSSTTQSNVQSNDPRLYYGAGAIDYRDDRQLLFALPEFGADPQKEKGLFKGMEKVNGSEYRTAGTASGTADVNDRGRGRTVETQSGALAVFDALYSVAGKAAYGSAVGRSGGRI
ncbi:glycoside hydrolase family 76 protein [Saccharata proteae CBS 121410]|uniref:Glycoside hydrolase family 76 protein n=1 Tax=Saccharata proteae CBS 121410 TaxID=1314787 RepID=A0A6A5YDX3_9PEZI|nr:glycoside hydrolase family 76 protein [Saccharata proteae CBS 121410]